MTATFDQLMNRATRQYLQILESDVDHADAEKRRLSKAQEAWEAFRGANCETGLETGFDPEGTMYSVGMWQCMTRMTRQRTRKIHDYLRAMPIPPFTESPASR